MLRLALISDCNRLEKIAIINNNNNNNNNIKCTCE